MSPVASSILAPSLDTIGRDFEIENESVRSLCLSIFVLGFALGPLLFAPLSEMYGRQIVLQCSQVIFFIFNGVCGFAQTAEQFLVFRFFGGIGGSAALALGPGVLADLYSADERGMASGIYALLPMLGPAIGPICGGFIAEHSSWRWGFWGINIVDVPILVIGMMFLEETYPPVLLCWRKQQMVRDTGNERLFTKYEQSDLAFRGRLAQAVMRPLTFMTTQIIVIIMGLYMSYLYGLMYVVLTTFPKLWTGDYQQSPSFAGLNYISLGLGYCGGIEVHPEFILKFHVSSKRLL
jgi:multidrug resistance protein